MLAIDAQLAGNLRKTLPDPPFADGLPVLGSLLPLLKDPVGFFEEQYRSKGPVYILKVPGGKQYTVLGGAEVARYVSTEGKDNISAGGVFFDWAHIYDAPHFLLALDGEEHKKARGLWRKEYSRASVSDNFDKSVAITECLLSDIPVDKIVFPLKDMTQLAAAQLGMMIAGTDARDIAEDAQYYVNLLMKKSAQGTLSKNSILKDKRFSMAAKNIERFAINQVNSRIKARIDQDSFVPNYIDRVIDHAMENPHDYTFGDILNSVMAPYTAGIEFTSNSFVSALYLLLKNEDSYHRVRAEADKLFAHGAINLKELRESKAINGTVKECLRLYPPAPTILRTAAKDFTYNGFHISKGSDLFILTAADNRNEKYFKNPDIFNIDRYYGEQSEPSLPNALTPFGVGQHVCIGMHIAEAQMQLTVAAILHKFEIKLVKPTKVYRQNRTKPVASFGINGVPMIFRKRN
jgi:cytochrome P450